MTISLNYSFIYWVSWKIIDSKKSCFSIEQEGRAVFGYAEVFIHSIVISNLGISLLIVMSEEVVVWGLYAIVSLFRRFLVSIFMYISVCNTEFRRIITQNHRSRNSDPLDINFDGFISSLSAIKSRLCTCNPTTENV